MNKKIRVNLSLDKKLVEQSRRKLKFFGGKLSTLFNAFLEDFIKSSEIEAGREYERTRERLKIIEEKIKKLEEKMP